MLGAYGEALTAVSEEIVAERKSATPSQDKILNRAFLLDYLTYNNLEHTVSEHTNASDHTSRGRGMVVRVVKTCLCLEMKRQDYFSILYVIDVLALPLTVLFIVFCRWLARSEWLLTLRTRAMRR